MAVKMQRADKQRKAVEAIEKFPSHVLYEYQCDVSGKSPTAVEPPGPAWLRALLGDDFFTDVADVFIVLPDDAVLVHVGELRRLKKLGFCVGTEVTDAGLVHLRRLTQLQELNLDDTKVTDQGATELQQALPNCNIRY